MKISTDAGITGQVAKELRLARGETQIVFWGRVGATQAGGCRYENGRSIPKPVKTLLFLNYVAGLDTNVSTAESAARMVYIAKLSSVKKSSDQLEQAKVELNCVVGQACASPVL